MKIYLFRYWPSIVISILGIAGPSQIAKDSRLQAAPIPAAVARSQALNKPTFQIIKTAPLMTFTQRYTYVFAGTAICQGQPCPNARIEVRVTSEFGEQIQHIITRSDGTYKTAFHLIGTPNETMSWEVNALTSDFQKVYLAGHQILTDELSVQMDLPLTFTES
jgi:hypothetical protein